jgi:uncharacterized protein
MSDEIYKGVPPRSEPLPLASTDNDDDFIPNISSTLGVTLEDRLFAIFSHLGGYFTWILVPLIFLLIQKDRRSFGAWHAREAINFNLTLLIYVFLPTPLLCLVFIDHELILVGVGLYFATMLVGAVFQLIVVIAAAIQAYRGVRWRCPLTVRFVPHPAAIEYSDDHADLD